MFTAVLFTVAKNWKQPKYPSKVNEYIKCSVCVYVCIHIHTSKYY